MTLDELREMADRVVAEQNDPESAHCIEDLLMESALEMIRDGAPNAVEIATIGLSTRELDFERWYA